MGLRPRSASAQICWVSTTSVNFGTYSVFSPTDLPATGGVSYFCLLGTRARTTCIGAGSGATVAQRRMVGLSGSIRYNLYIDAAHTRIWGDAPPNCLVDTGFSVLGRYTVFGLIPAAQDVAVGSYSDSVVVTLLF